MKEVIIFVSVFVFVCSENVNESQQDKKKLTWREKDMRDMTDADLERLLDEWEKNDDPLEPDELPEYLRPAQPIDISKIDMTNPDNILRATKKGKGVMMFVDVKTDISVEEADVILQRWQSSLQNNHVIAERYPISPRRAVFMFREGSQALDARDFLIEQPELAEVLLEGQTFHGKHNKKGSEAATKKKPKERSGKSKKNEL